jgi:hypothetical protein
MSRPQTEQGSLWKGAIAEAVLLAKANDIPWLDTFERGDRFASQRLTNSQTAAMAAYYYTAPSEQLRKFYAPNSSKSPVLA